MALRTALGIVRSRPWLSLAALLAIGSGVGLALSLPVRASQAVLGGWNLGALVYLGAVLRLMLTDSPGDMRRRAETQDVGKWSILVLTGLAVAACMVAIATELIAARSLSGVKKGVALALSGATIMTTWLFVHTTFALHYAHAWYTALDAKQDAPLRFPEALSEPDYFDFAYFAFIIGTAAQTADVSVASKAMRRLNLGHCIFAFVYNTTILALGINIAASLMGN